MAKYYKARTGTPVDAHNQTTAKAVKLQLAKGGLNGRTVWLPKSIIRETEPNDGGWGDVYIPAWWIRKSLGVSNLGNVIDWGFEDSPVDLPAELQ